MTRPADILAEAHVQRLLKEYLSECDDSGKRPSVLGLATRLGLSNTTFRRHFPQQAQDVSAARSSREPPAAAQGLPSRYETLAARNARLRRANRALTGNLRLAAAQIQHLGMENDRLRDALESSSNVSRIDQPSKQHGR